MAETSKRCAIRVAFVVPRGADGWLGGLNYISNLIAAVQASESVIEPVVLVPVKMGRSFSADIGRVELIETVLADQASLAFKAGRVLRRLIGRDLIFEAVLRRHDICVLSHSVTLGRHARLPTIAWIPDFQHRRMPEFFSTAELKNRDRSFLRLLTEASTVVVSSEDALCDLTEFAPSAAAKSRVLRFISGAAPVGPDAIDEETGRLATQPFFLLPNQLWKHKNHMVVIDAAGILRRRGRPVRVLATGSKTDYRHPDHLDDILARIAKQGVSEDFQLLGTVPHATLAVLMQQAVAIINPSLFEGWSTTVEEGKSLGKKILLSDIPVHREQAPPRGILFSPDNPEMLADAMSRALFDFDAATEKRAMEEAAKSFARRRRDYGKAYEKVVLETISHRSRSTLS